MKSIAAQLIFLGAILASAGILYLSRSGDSMPVQTAGVRPSPPVRDWSFQQKPPVSGAQVYRQNCAICHGEKGLGDGPVSLYLIPKPRDFSKGQFKIHSTPYGDVPTDQDLLRTITQGMPGSAMPSFAHLSEPERNALVEFIKNLSVIVTDDGTEIRPFRDWEKRVIPVSQESPATPQSIETGKKLYVAKGCIKCHGVSGRGDGSSAGELKDDWGYPIRPNNFTRGIYKGGGENRDIYMRFTAGMNGTPMPSSKDVTSDAERWALVHYIKSLAGPRVARQSARSRILVKKISDPLGLNPLDPVWDKVPASDLPLMQTWQRQEAAETLSVRAAQNGTHVAFLLEWEDADVNSAFLRPQDFTDGAAVQFYPGALDVPVHFTMGEKGKPVNTWYWRMDRQIDVARHADVDQAYPNMVSDTAVLREVKSPFLDPDFLSGQAAGNIMSQVPRLTAVENLKAEGFGTLAPLPQHRQVIEGRGLWSNGVWRVVVVRKVSDTGAGEAQFLAGSSIPVAFGVWDGSHQDRDGKKSVTTWQILEVEK